MSLPNIVVTTQPTGAARQRETFAVATGTGHKELVATVAELHRAGWDIDDLREDDPTGVVTVTLIDGPGNVCCVELLPPSIARFARHDGGIALL